MTNFIIEYGIENNRFDISSKFEGYNIITIPPSDNFRASLYSDPLPGTLKKIFISTITNGIKNLKLIISNSQLVFIDVNSQKIFIDNISQSILDSYPYQEDIAMAKLMLLHKKLNFKHGSMLDEVPEQLMSMLFLKGDEKVLEIGSNIGRNSMIIASLLKTDKNFVTMECDNISCVKLTENKFINNFNFNSECAALSKRKLIQRGWITKPSEILEEGYSFINTISYDELLLKYKINFDTLVADCEGALFYILQDMPEILDNIKKIIVENDYPTIEDKIFVDNLLKDHSFICVYTKPLLINVNMPCKENFYEVWIKS